MQSLNDRYRQTGTRFRLFAQSPVLSAFKEPETVWVSSRAGSLGPGPSDQRMVTRDPIDKKPYEGEMLPPWRGRIRPPVLPGPGGHFDHLSPDDRGFMAAHMFGSVRRVLDIWETYLGGPIAWPFALSHPRLELIPHVPWNNAHFGWGFMEAGEGKDDQGIERPFALNFDVLAHEAGHGIVFSVVGMPPKETMTTAFRGFHESASDMTAMISTLHFDSILEHVLETTEGNLFLANEANRIGELSETRQIRSACNPITMSDVVPLSTPVDEVTGKQVHKLGQPMSGAIFDILIEIFEERLEHYKLIPDTYAAEVRSAVEAGRAEEMETGTMTEAYRANPAGFRKTLAEARDIVGRRIAHSWHLMSPHNFTYSHAAMCYLAADRALSGARYQDLIRASFKWREIDA
ncbi:MAG: hypothetical protein AAFR79_02165, partial [Pseudomonadota bacterium]